MMLNKFNIQVRYKSLKSYNTILLIIILLFISLGISANEPEIIFSPDKNGYQVNPDTHLELTFGQEPGIGTTGQIRVYDASNDQLVDLLDLSIPPGPTSRDTTTGAIYTPVPYQYDTIFRTNADTKSGTPSGLALPTPDNYQLTIIGGFTDGFHYYPVIIRENKAIITLHNNLLEYGKKYYVEIDKDAFILNDRNFTGIEKGEWTFKTKKNPPHKNVERFIVSDDGSGDFNTVQGAIDYVPYRPDKQVEIYVRNGIYEEIVYFRNKANITIKGESRDSVVIQYANNEVFNPHPVNIKTNEVPGTFPSRRAAFAADFCKGITLENLTIKNLTKGQAEGLLLNGEKIIVSNVTIIGSGDALQTNGPVYFSNCLIVGDGDTVLGRGPAFFKNCELHSQWVFMWIRNTEENHGNVFVNCKFIKLGEGETEIARCPTNHGKDYPFIESVLISCQLQGISPVAWGTVGGETSNVHYWEYNSTNLSDGLPVDVSQRHPVSKQLTLGADSIIIINYSNPEFVLNGWKPVAE